MHENQELNEFDQSLLGQDLDMLAAQATANEQTDSSVIRYKPKLNLIPSLNLQPNTSTFVRQVTLKLTDLGVPFKSRTNLSSSLQRTLRSLQRKDDNIVIKPADKGGNTVKLGKHQYVAMCQRILKNRSWYESLANLVQTAHQDGNINGDTKEFLITRFPKTPFFVPKIHKGVLSHQADPLSRGLAAPRRKWVSMWTTTYNLVS